MTIPVHIAIDLESLALRPAAVVLSAGLAAFTVPGGLVGTYYAQIDQTEQRLRGRVINPATQAWWESQPEEARSVLNNSKSMPVLEALAGVTAFINRFDGGSYRIGGVWGYGSDFDNAMLQDLFMDFVQPVPWTYKQNRCGRTVTRLANITKPKNNGVHHNALDDAIWQAEYIRQSLLQLGVTQ